MDNYYKPESGEPSQKRFKAEPDDKITSLKVKKMEEAVKRMQKRQNKSLDY